MKRSTWELLGDIAEGLRPTVNVAAGQIAAIAVELGVQILRYDRKPVVNRMAPHAAHSASAVDEPVDLPEGAEVPIEVAEDVGPTLAERLASVIGKAEGLPEDWAEKHDKYLREEHGR